MAESKTTRGRKPAQEKPKVFDVDAQSSAYQPVEVKFRGKQYQLGRDTAGLLYAAEAYNAVPDPLQTPQGQAPTPEQSASQTEYVTKLVEILPSVLTALNGDFPTDDLTAGEESALLNVVTEVLSRMGDLSF